MAKLTTDDIGQGVLRQGDKMMGSGHPPGFLRGKGLAEAGRGLCDYLAWLNDNTGYEWEVSVKVGARNTEATLIRTKDDVTEEYPVELAANPTDTANPVAALEKIAVKMIKNAILKEAPNEIL